MTVVTVKRDEQDYQIWLDGKFNIKPGSRIRVDGGRWMRVLEVRHPLDY